MIWRLCGEVGICQIIIALLSVGAKTQNLLTTYFQRTYYFPACDGFCRRVLALRGAVDLNWLEIEQTLIGVGSTFSQNTFFAHKTVIPMTISNVFSKSTASRLSRETQMHSNLYKHGHHVNCLPLEIFLKCSVRCVE